MIAPRPIAPPIERRQRIARVAITLGFVALGAWMVGSFLPALLWAGIIGIAVAPLRARIVGRWPGLAHGALLPALLTTAIGLLVLVPIGFGIARAAAEAQDAVRWFAQARANGLPVPDWVYDLPWGARSVAGWWQEHLATPEAATAQLHRFDAQALISRGRLLSSGLIRRSVVFAFTLFALFFLLRDGALLTAQARIFGARLFGPSSDRIAAQITLSIRGTIDGLVLVGLAEGLLMTVAYLIAGVTHPLLLGAATAIAAMIPFGAVVMFAIAGLLLLVKSAVVAAIAVVAFGLVVIAVADHLVRPAMIGGATRLPFLWVLIGILGGVESFGLLGLFIGPATMAVLVMFWRELVTPAPPP